MLKLSVLMPVYNESRTLRTIVAKVLEAPVDLAIELVCVDDCSTDTSLEVLNELAASDERIRVFAQPHKMGKGKAIRAAIEHMTGDIAIIQDADLEYDPSDYQLVVAPIIEGRADAVFGSRFAASEQRRVLFFWHALGSRLLTLMSTGHVRCFTHDEIEEVVRAFGLEIVRPEEVNKLSALGWRLHHALGAGRISKAEARAFDWFVPLARRLDPVLLGAGLSLLVVARVP